MEKKWRMCVLSLVLSLLIIFSILGFTDAEIQNGLNDSSTEKNFSAVGPWSNLTYIQLPKTSSVIIATLNLTGVSVLQGLSLANETDNTEDDWNSTGSFVGSFPASNAVDESFSSYARVTNPNTGNVYINYTKQANASSAAWEVKYGSSTNCGTGAITIEGFCMNQTGGYWLSIFQENIPAVTIQTNQSNFSIDSSCFSASIIELRVELDSGDASDMCSQLWEEQVHWSVDSGSYPANVTLDIGNDGDAEFNHTGELTTKNTTSDFASEIMAFLSTCTADANGFCDVPLNISGTNGQVTLDAINITYTEFPVLNITFPINGTIYDATVTAINYTASDTNISACWYSLDSGATNTTLTCGQNVTGLDSGEGDLTWTVYANDSNNHMNSSSVTFSVAFVPPTINLDYPPNDTNFTTQLNIYLNYTVTDPNGIDTVEIWHDFNGSFSKNLTRTDISSGVQAFNIFNFSSDGIFNWNIWANDTTGLGQFNDTNFTFTIDTTSPQINIIVTPNGTLSSLATLDINFTTADNIIGVDTTSCKWSKDAGATNVTLSGCTNITAETFPEGSSVVDIWASDLLGNEGKNTTIFIVDLTDPTAQFVAPTLTTGTFINQNYIEVNITGSDANLDSLTIDIYNGGGVLNQTNTSSSSPLYVNLSSLIDGVYFYNATINDSSGRETLLSTRNVTLDTIFPQITINNSQIITTIGSQTISFNHTSSDTNLGTCKYSFDGGNTNNSLICNEPDKTATTTSFGTFNLTIYVTDMAGNENSSKSEFTIVDNPPVNGGGGGGGGIESVERIPVVGLEEIQGLRTYNNLEREIIFAEINKFCAEKDVPEEEFLAIRDFSGECALTFSELSLIEQRLAMLGISVPLDDLELFYNEYVEKKLFQGFETLEIIDEYGLFTTVLGIINPLTFLPSTIDSIYPLLTKAKNITLDEIILVNKNIRECTVTRGAPNLKCEIIGNTSLRVSYIIEDLEFWSKIFEGEISITSDADPQNLEVKPVHAVFRTYNLARSILGIPAWVVAIVVIATIIAGIIIYRKWIRKGRPKSS